MTYDVWICLRDVVSVIKISWDSDSSRVSRVPNGIGRCSEGRNADRDKGYVKPAGQLEK